MQKRPIILRSLLIVATPYDTFFLSDTFNVQYGVATSSRLLQIIGLFCRILSLLLGSFAKETYNFREPTNCSHPIPVTVRLSHVHIHVSYTYIHVYMYVIRSNIHTVYMIHTLVLCIIHSNIHTCVSVCICIHSHIHWYYTSTDMEWLRFVGSFKL